MSEPNEPSSPIDPSDREDRAILAALAVLEAEDPELVLGDALRPGTDEAGQADVTLRRLYVETLGLLAHGAPEGSEEQVAAVKGRLMAAIGAAPAVAAPAERAAEAAEVVPISTARAAAEPAPPRRRSWLTAIAALFAIGAVGLAGWFYYQLDRTQEALNRLETDRARLAERLDRQEDLIRHSSGMVDFVSAVSSPGVEICPLRPVGDPASHPDAFAVLYMPPGSGEWYVLASNLKPGPGVYTVWLNTTTGPRSMGVLEAGEDSTLEFKLPPDINERHDLMQSITVTLEPAPDMPDPSGPAVLFGNEVMKVL